MEVHEKWEKEHQVKERKIKPHHIKPVDDVEDIHTIEESDIAHIVVLAGWQNLGNLVGEIDIELLKLIKAFIAEDLIFITHILIHTFLNFL